MCNCDTAPGFRVGPCEIHEAAAFAEWLPEEAPRAAAARKSGDPLYSRRSFPAQAGDVPELANLRAALSEPARELLDKQWSELARVDSQWPYANELVLAARDEWRTVTPVYERDVLRGQLATQMGVKKYPFKDDSEGGEIASDQVMRFFVAERLRKEADVLAELSRRALELERMLRDHAAGWSTSATDYPPDGRPS
ncbi:hypothetical protein [Streptosporangium sp. NPDC087985]|uniref:hypothetical protein n=1 Tax=Streptosporangium sp. NPDC087985 TaxID=3366196 RepID=UPI0038132DB1